MNHIVLLEMNSQSASQPQTTADWLIRPMVPGDLPRVVDLDAAAFDPLWRNSLEGLASAFNQACYASVAEDDSGLIGYQLATGGAFGTHLARLAVQPAAQGRGLGAALVHDLIAHIPRDREPRLTVNTQADNKASHALYERLGFRRTGERFPVLAAICGIGAANTVKSRRRELNVLQSSWQDKNGIKLHLQAWEPDTRPKAVVGVLHGLGEHVARYTSMAQALVKARIRRDGLRPARSRALRGQARPHTEL